jgi:hypothetical protein
VIEVLNRAWPYLAAVLVLALAVCGAIAFLPRRRPAAAAVPPSDEARERRRVEELDQELVRKDDRLGGTTTADGLVQLGRERGYR